MKEIEVKILEINSKKIRQILKKNKAKLVKKVFQRNIFYSSDLLEKNGVTARVRQENNNFWFTVKSPTKIINNHKVRKEYEKEIESCEFGEEMFDLLGLSKIGIGEIKREYWKIHNCSVEICDMPRIPVFLEIEGSEVNILKVAKLLGYSEKDYFPGNIIAHYNIKDKFLVFKK